MADYTVPILMAIATFIVYNMVYVKNRFIGSVLFISMGIASIYVYPDNILFSYIIIFSGILSIIYDIFGRPRGLKIRG